MSQPAAPPTIRFTQLFINNTFVDAAAGGTFETLNPATGAKIADVAEARAADVARAVAAAKAAFARGSAWRTLDASARGGLLLKLAALMERDKEQLAALDALDNGKPFAEALGIDLHLAIKCFRYYAGWACV